MGRKSKRMLSLEEIENLDDETYYFIKYLDKQIDKLQYEKELAEVTLKKVQDLINSNEEICFFYSAKKEFNKPINDYFKKVK